MTKDKPSAPENPVELVRYIKNMVGQLESLAISAGLDILAYYLSMAKSEGELTVRRNANSDTLD